MLKEWVKKYPVDIKKIKALMSGPVRGSDMEQTLSMLIDPKALQEAIADSNQVAGEKDKKKTDAGADGVTPGRGDYEGPESVEVEDCTNGEVLRGTSHYFDRSQVRRLTERMAQAFSVRRGHISTESPSRRLSARALASGSSKIYRIKTITRPNRANINLYVDLSGSMAGKPSGGGAGNRGRVLRTCAPWLHQRSSCIDGRGRWARTGTDIQIAGIRLGGIRHRGVW